jgi:hypothetical protein
MHISDHYLAITPNQFLAVTRIDSVFAESAKISSANKQNQLELECKNCGKRGQSTKTQAQKEHSTRTHLTTIFFYLV